MQIFVLCPDYNLPAGGIKGLYRYVDVLNRHGYDAFIVHLQKNFRVDWFQNKTPVVHMRNGFLIKYFNKIKNRFQIKSPIRDVFVGGPVQKKISRDDLVVIPIIMLDQFASYFKNNRKIIFNRRVYSFTFRTLKLTQPVGDDIYLSPELLGVLTVSKDSQQYLEYAFPGQSVHIIRPSISSLFHWDQRQKKEKQICFMPRRRANDAHQVLGMLQNRRALKDFTVIELKNLTEEQTADALKKASIFLSLSDNEGFGRPPAEAMAAGCIVVGYHGMGGREFFLPEFSYPIENGDIVQFAATVEKVVQDLSDDDESYLNTRLAASAFIRETYSPEQEEQDIMTSFNKLLGGH